MDNTVVEEGVLDTREQGPQEEDDEHDVIEPAESFTDSEDDVNDDDFLYDRNNPDHIAVGLNSDLVVEEQNADTIGEDSNLDNSYDPTAEELETDYSSDKETPVRYHIFNEDKELWDPQFEVGKIFTDGMRFMPTPGIIEEHNSGPAVVLLRNDVEKNLSFDNMVDDLQLMQHEEQSRMKAQWAKNIRDSVRLHATRNRKPD